MFSALCSWQVLPKFTLLECELIMLRFLQWWPVVRVMLFPLARQMIRAMIRATQVKHQQIDLRLSVAVLIKGALAMPEVSLQLATSWLLIAGVIIFRFVRTGQHKNKIRRNELKYWNVGSQKFTGLNCTNNEENHYPFQIGWHVRI